MRLDLIARCGTDFLDFRPYVPAIDGAGCVVFQAVLPGGGAGVFLGEGGACDTLYRTDGGLVPCSHPDRNDRGDWAVYARRPDGSTALLGCREGGLPGGLLDARPASLSAIGPLGPVIDAGGLIALRAETARGHAAVCTWRDGALGIVATAGEGGFSAFHGLPVPAGGAGLLFRADGVDGREGLFRFCAGRIDCLASSGEGFRSLSAFPAMTAGGDVAFGAVDEDGYPVLVHRQGRAERRVRPGTESGIARFRGVLLADGGDLYATADTADGGVAVFAVHDDRLLRVLGTGDRCLGSTLSALALNPVSVNAAGQLALRVLLTDGGQAIVRLSGGGAAL